MARPAWQQRGGVPATPQELNRSAYARNNPLRSTDPTGHHPCVAFLAGGPVGAGVAASCALFFLGVAAVTYVTSAAIRHAVEEGAGLPPPPLSADTGGQPALPPAPTPDPDLNSEWRVGDPINKRDVQGRYPSWETVRSRYWQNRAQSASPDEFSRQNIGLMRNGLAPKARIIARMKETGEETEMLVTKELHHMAGRGGLDPHHLNNLVELWPWEHAAIDPQRHLSWTFVRFASHP